MRPAVRAGAFAATLVVAGAHTGGAQDAVVERLQLDRLQLTALGVGAGTIAPYQVVPATVYVAGSDFGEISPAWHVIFRVSYWASRFEPSVVQAFVDTIQKNLADPSATTVKASPVPVYDVTFAIGARRLLVPRASITPFFSGGLAAHVINAEGALIRGTFVERALDNIGAGVFAEAGVRASVFRNVLIEGSVRGDLLSGFRSTEWYAMGSYFFGAPRRGGSGR